MELTTEKFEALKELSELQSTIGLLRVEFQTLTDSIAEYKEQREKETLATVQSALLASREALVEADANKDAVASLLTKAQELAVYLEKFTTTVEETANKQLLLLNESFALIDDKVRELSNESENLKTRRRILEDDEKNLLIVKENFNKKERVLNDRLQMVERTMKRITMIK